MSTPAAEFRSYRQTIEETRKELETKTAQKEALNEKHLYYSTRLEKVKNDLIAAEEARKTALRRFAINEAPEADVTESVFNIVDLETATRTTQDILKTIKQAIVDVEEEERAIYQRLGKATAAAWQVLFTSEVEKAAPLLARLFALHNLDRKARFGVMAVSNEQTFIEVMRSVGAFSPTIVNVTANDHFTAEIGTDPLERFWKY